MVRAGPSLVLLATQGTVRDRVLLGALAHGVAKIAAPVALGGLVAVSGIMARLAAVVAALGLRALGGAVTGLVAPQAAEGALVSHKTAAGGAEGGDSVGVGRRRAGDQAGGRRSGGLAQDGGLESVSARPVEVVRDGRHFEGWLVCFCFFE